MHRAVRAAGLAAALCAAAGPGAAAPTAEQAPAQGTRLRFQKTLFIQATARGRVFAETLQWERDASLLEVLATDYGVEAEAAPPLVEAFRALNPGVEPDRIPAHRTVRVPFKIEERQLAAKTPPVEKPQSYTVKKGDSLWRILKNRYKVAREAMGGALAAVAKANPGVRDLNRLVAGQTLTIPAAAADLPAGPPAASSAGASRTTVSLLEALGCQWTTAGEVFLPLARGRTVRLDAREFPLVTGPTGRRVVLDGATRLGPALANALEKTWGFAVVSGTELAPGAQLENLLPKLGFHQLTEGKAEFPVGRGVTLAVDTRWTVVPREEDLWEGRVHLLFAKDGPPVGSGLAALAGGAGFSLHQLGGETAVWVNGSPTPPPVRVAGFSMVDPAAGAAVVLEALGVPHRVRPEVECDLGGGVLYRLHPELSFDHAGTAYAVSPREPKRAEALLSRAGYFAVSLPDPASPLDRLADLLALVGVSPKRTVVEVPKGQALRLRLEGVSFEHRGLCGRLYPNVPYRAGLRILLTLAEVSPEAAAALIDEGFLPWLVRAPAAAAPSLPRGL